MFVEISIIVGVVVLFVVSTLLNNRVKAPDGCEVPDGCGSCTTTSCSIKSVIQNTQAVEDKKNELKAYLRSVEEQEAEQSKKTV
jgi:hypothetical protein